MSVAEKPLRRLSLTPFMLLLGTLVFGTSMIEFNSRNAIPLTVRHFTSNATLIGFIVALNALFSFLVQPVVAWKSDRIWTRIGRRVPIILGSAPVLALSILLTPFMPNLGTLVVVLIVWQFTNDVMTSVFWPMFADVLPADRLGRMSGFSTSWAQLGQIVMGFIAMALMDRWEPSPYIFAAVFTMWGFMVVLLFVREPKPEHILPSEKFNVVSYFKEIFGQKDYRHIFMYCFLNIVAHTAYQSFIALFATETIGMSKKLLGWSLGISPIICLVFAIPTGHLVDKVQKRFIVIAGHALLIIGAIIGLLASNTWQVFAMSVIAGIGIFLSQITENPLYFEYIPPERRGTICGATPMIRGLAQFITYPAVGALADLTGAFRYRVMYPIVLIFSIATIILMTYMREGKYSGRLKQEG